MSSGFALPMALVAALVLLLGSLSLQTAGLAERRRTLGAWRVHQAEDRLVSAAHQLVGALQLRFPCLAEIPLASWPSAEGACASAAEQEALRQFGVFGHPVRLVAWQPRVAAEGEPRVDLLLELEAHEGAPARRAAFEVRLAAEPPRVRDLRLLGLQGVSP